MTTLLLCGRFGPAREAVRLLAPSEYRDLAQWLDAHGLSFAALLGTDARAILQSYAGRGASIEIERLLAHCAANLAKYKVPASIAIVDALPRTTVGKIDKRALRAV